MISVEISRTIGKTLGRDSYTLLYILDYDHSTHADPQLRLELLVDRVTAHV